jgi:DNA-directed RNA polymerase subunit RPC12/RpoP
MNREQYLQKATKHFAKSLFAPAGYEVPADVKVTTSLPSRRAFGTKKRTIGQCYSRECSDAKVNEVFISPTIDNSIEVLATLVHELVHAIDNCEHGHKKEFIKIARAVGLQGKPTECTAVEGTKLYELLEKYVEKNGKFPHKKIDIFVDTKKQSTRMIKIECPHCGFKVRASRKVIDEIDNNHVQCWSCGSRELQIDGVPVIAGFERLNDAGFDYDDDDDRQEIFTADENPPEPQENLKPAKFGDIKKYLGGQYTKAINWIQKERRRNREFRTYWQGIFHGSGRWIYISDADGKELLRESDIKTTLGSVKEYIEIASKEGVVDEVTLWTDIYGITNPSEREYSESERVDWAEAEIVTITLKVKDGKLYDLEGVL